MFISFFIFNAFSCSSFSAELNTNVTLSEKQCYDAKNGVLDLESTNLNNPINNAFLFNCVVSVAILDPSLVSGESKSKKRRLAKKNERAILADALLAKDIDIEYTNEYGDTLIMSVILSFLQDEWKVKTVISLIKKGADTKAINSSGETALTLAKYKNLPEIVEILSEIHN